MDDQGFARKYVQSGRRIEIAARPLSVGRGASDHLILEKEKVLDWRRYRIERGLALSRGEPDFKNAFLARKHHRFSKRWPNCQICSFLSSLRPGSRDQTSKRYQHR
jgi:hypothetical protein